MTNHAGHQNAAPRGRHTISAAVDHAVQIHTALVSDINPVAPTATLRGCIKDVLVAMDGRGLFTWYERLGVFLLTIRRG